MEANYNNRKMIQVDGKWFAVWPNDNGGHICEPAEKIGWTGPTMIRPDFAGGTYVAPMFTADEYHRLPAVDHTLVRDRF